MKKILVIAAHPDDEVLGCGATIAKECAEGSEVKIVILATGVTSRHENISADLDETVKAELDKLYENSISAATVLGVKQENIVFGEFPDQKLDALPILDIMHFLKKIVQSFKPDVVYTHHHGDYNKDHRIVFDATLSVCRPYAGEHYPAELYSFEVLSSTEWAFQTKDSFAPTVYVSVEDTIEKKKNAMVEYEGELKEFPHPRSIEGVDVLAKKRGSEISMPYAEAFEAIRLIR